MAEELRLLSRVNKTTGQAACIFCKELFELLSTAMVLCEGELPRGYVCHDCLIAGPVKVAAHIRKHVQRLRDQAAKAAAMPGEQWLGIVRASLERARYWEALASRTEKLPQWALQDFRPA